MASLTDILQGGLSGLKAPIEAQVKEAATDEVKKQLLPLAYGAGAIALLSFGLWFATPYIKSRK